MQRDKLLHDYAPPGAARIALLMSGTSRRFAQLGKSRNLNLSGVDRITHVCLCSPPYGLIPSELEDTFPFSQTESPDEPDFDTLLMMAETLQRYLSQHGNYQTLVLVRSNKEWQMRFARMCKRLCRKIAVRYSCYGEQEILSGLTGILNKEKKHLHRTAKREPFGRKS